MNYKQSFVCLVMFACALLAGCIGTDSKYPLSSVESAVADPGVIGTWLASDGKEKLTIKIESAGDQFPKNMLRLSIVDNVRQEFAGYCYITKMTGQGKHANVHCVNVVDFKDDRESQKWNPDDIAGYQVFAYKLIDGEIHLFDPNEKFLLSAVEQGAVQGVDEASDSNEELEELDLESIEDPDDEEVEGVQLREPTDGLNKFFNANFGKIFPKVTIKMTRKK